MLHIIKQIKGNFMWIMESKFDSAWFNAVSFVDEADKSNDWKLNFDEMVDLMNSLSKENEELYSEKYNIVETLLNQAIAWQDVRTQEMIRVLQDKQEGEIWAVIDTYTEYKDDIISDASYWTESIMVKGLDTLKWVVLERGSKWPKVKILQELLMSLWYELPKFKADWDFGNELKTALTLFQEDYELENDGVFGPNTFNQLKSAYESNNQHINTDHSSALYAENIVINSLGNTKANQEKVEKVEKIIITLKQAKIINNAFEAYFNKAEIKDVLKDSWGDIASIFQEDNFLNYLGNQDSTFKEWWEYYENAKSFLKNYKIKKIDNFEENKLKTSLTEWAIYYWIVWVPLFKINITDNQNIKVSKLDITNASNLYDSLKNNTTFSITKDNNLSDQINSLDNASKEQKDEITRSFLRNIDFEERNNVYWAMFSWSEKNLFNFLGGDKKADDVSKLIIEYKTLVEKKWFDINKAMLIIEKINSNLKEQYNEEVAENFDNELIDYIDTNYPDARMDNLTDNSFSIIDWFKTNHKKEYKAFKKNKYWKANTRVESANDILDRTNTNWWEIKKFRNQIENSGNDLTTFNEVKESGDKYAIKLAAIIEVFDVKTLWIDNLLNAHPVISSGLETKLRNIDFDNADLIIGASKDSEVIKYINAIQNETDYKKYFENELNKETVPYATDVKKGRFGVPLSKYESLSDWADALSQTGTTWISTLANISLQLSKQTGLQVTPEELKSYIASWDIEEREDWEIVTNFANNWNSIIGKAGNLTTKEYVTFDVSKEYEVFTEDGTKLMITEKVPIDLKTDCANLNLDTDSATYSITEITKDWIETNITIDEALSRVETGGFTVPLLGVSALGAIIKNNIWSWKSSWAWSKPGMTDPIDIPIPTTPQPQL